jgi:hypothetical protein
LTQTELHLAAAEALVAGGERIDARPIRSTSTDTLWDRAIALRNQLGVQMRTILESEGVDALVFVSASGEYPPWAKLEAWSPASAKSGVDESGRVRGELLLVVEVRPYQRHQLVINARATRGHRSIRLEQQPEFSQSEVAEWTRCTIGRAGIPSRYHHPFGRALLNLLAELPLVRYHAGNPVDHAYRNRFFLTATGFLGLSSVILLVVGFFTIRDDPTLPVLLLITSIAMSFTMLLLMRQRTHVVFVPPQPVVPPRDLGLVDSWHAVVAELGLDFTEVKQRLMRSIAEESGGSLTCETEIYGYRTPNGYEERERLVVTKGQGIVHVHIYRFSDDVFVGWHAYLNWAKWDEAGSVPNKVKLGHVVEFRELRRGYYLPNQFDLIDLNSLSELVHRRLERELRSILKEKAIDQEIDFLIIRGDRDRALDESRRSEEAPRRSWRYLRPNGREGLS